MLVSGGGSDPSGVWPGLRLVSGSVTGRAVSGIVGGSHSRWVLEAAVAVRFSVTVRQVLEDGSEVPADAEVAAALAGTAESYCPDTSDPDRVHSSAADRARIRVETHCRPDRLADVPLASGSLEDVESDRADRTVARRP